jgi:glycosyltransferase involved in cell wall biosynthesis
VIYYGCEHDRFHPDVAPADAETLAQHGITTPFLIYVGGFTQRKNVRNLLAAWKILEPQHPDLSLVLVGPTSN